MISTSPCSVTSIDWGPSCRASRRIADAARQQAEWKPRRKCGRQLARIRHGAECRETSKRVVLHSSSDRARALGWNGQILGKDEALAIIGERL